MSSRRRHVRKPSPRTTLPSNKVEDFLTASEVKWKYGSGRGCGCYRSYAVNPLEELGSYTARAVWASFWMGYPKQPNLAKHPIKKRRQAHDVQIICIFFNTFPDTLHGYHTTRLVYFDLEFHYPTVSADIIQGDHTGRKKPPVVLVPSVLTVLAGGGSLL